MLCGEAYARYVPFSLHSMLCWKICNSHFMSILSLQIQNFRSQFKCLDASHLICRTGNEIYTHMFIILVNVWFISDFRNYKHRGILIFLCSNQHSILFADWILHIGITEIIESMTLNTSITVVKAEFGTLYEKHQSCQFFLCAINYLCNSMSSYFPVKAEFRYFLTQTKIS
jgi:hypothetical protein